MFGSQEEIRLADLGNNGVGESVSASVASVTVAFNAVHLLPRQIEALLRQTHPLQEIVVVDNGSTDDTGKMLADRYPQVTVLRLNENIGMAGACAVGLAYAVHEKGVDWAWTFDDDSLPPLDSLARLLEGIGSLNGTAGEVGMIAPMPVHKLTGRYYPPLFWRDGFVKPSAQQMREPLWFADMVITSGCLIRRQVVEKIGLPRADFFMDFFDYEYSLRARSHGYKIAVLPKAEVAHEIGDARNVWLPSGSRLWTSYAPWREYYNSRNLTYAGWHLYPSRRTKRFVLRHLGRHASAVVLFSPRKLACLKKMVQGFRDGYRAKLGIRFRPDGP
jgi:rhamnopyranosyl-N-acetylglucosaminyl-diphospho-decaprenol beta-1,3/1,4-galactofuranosyltransferase